MWDFNMRYFPHDYLSCDTFNTPLYLGVITTSSTLKPEWQNLCQIFVSLSSSSSLPMWNPNSPGWIGLSSLPDSSLNSEPSIPWPFSSNPATKLPSWSGKTLRTLSGAGSLSLPLSIAAELWPSLQRGMDRVETVGSVTWKDGRVRVVSASASPLFGYQTRKKNGS